MFALSLAALLILLVVSFVALHRAHKGAADGYEDEGGFHLGVESSPLEQTVFIETREVPARSGRAALADTARRAPSRLRVASR
jgi:hypothetical protein